MSKHTSKSFQNGTVRGGNLNNFVDEAALRPVVILGQLVVLASVGLQLFGSEVDTVLLCRALLVLGVVSDAASLLSRKTHAHSMNLVASLEEDLLVCLLA